MSDERVKIQKREVAASASVDELPVVEIGHLFPNYRPQIRAQVHYSSVLDQAGDDGSSNNSHRKRKAESQDNRKVIKKKTPSTNERSDKDKQGGKWEKMFERLRSYKEQHGVSQIAGDKLQRQ